MRPAQRMFGRIIGIDYSGADTPIKRTNKLHVYSTEGHNLPERVCIHPRQGNAKHWHRRGIAEWLMDELANPAIRTIVGIDHAFSFPIDYFDAYGLAGHGWDAFLDDFHKYWPTDGDNALVAQIRAGTGQGRTGDSRWEEVDRPVLPHRKIAVPIQLPRLSGTLHPCRSPLAPAHPTGIGGQGPLLALRRLEHPPLPIRHRRGVPGTLEPPFQKRGEIRRRTRCLQHRGLAVLRGQERLAPRIFPSRP